ncbi:fn3 and I-set and Ig 2 domain containing protein [Trichuris trichiura]|uniref:Fn3 and I-set and Ig 2 domain containing protein n=1 Tax=Trichuris trichiura TaxID=36087 RepID=A0A077Z8W1_TRITR|nr:fn3 and I-set and Ig 2 domain containing protein [Trichuris trichiura]
MIMVHSKSAASPRLVVEPSDSIFFSDLPAQTIRLHCLAEQSARVRSNMTYTWYHGSGGSPVNSLKRSHVVQIDGDLLFYNVSVLDMGTYFCKVTNPYGAVISRKAHVRSAYVLPFPSSRLDVFAVEGKGKHIPCLAPSHYPVSVSFAWLQKSSKVFLAESERIFVGKDGALFFSYFTKNDEDRYACTLLISELQTGHYGPFFRLRSRQDGKGSVFGFEPRFPREMPRIWPPKSVVKGGHVILECFAYGSPSPQYSWSRVDEPLNGSYARLENFNRELHIPLVEVHHTGLYRCVAENKHGWQAKEIYLDVAAAPELKVFAADQVAKAGNSLELSCEAFGKPTVRYEWLKNGTSLNPLLLNPDDRRRIKIGGHKLQISKLVEEDSGVYQCLAFNVFGQQIHTIEVYVAPLHLISERRDVHKEFHVLENSKAILHCGDAENQRLNNGRWRIHNTQLSRDARLHLSKFRDILTIEHVSRNDSDKIYECNINYRHVVVVEHVKIMVYYDISISVEPNSTHALMGNAVTLTCRYFWLTKVPKHSQSLPWWSFNGYPIERLRQFTMARVVQIPHGGQSLHVPVVSTLHQGNYSCHVSILPSCIIVAQARVTIEGPPLPPVNLTAKPETPNRVWVSWRIPAEQNNKTLSIERFKVEIKSTYTEGWQLATDDIVGSARETVIDNHFILPFNKYRFRVRAFNKIGWSEASHATSWTETPPGPPNIIENLRLKARVLEPGKIVLSWTPLPPQHWGDANVGYLLEWRPLGNFNSTNTVRIAPSPKRSAELSTYTVETNETVPCRRYELLIRPYNGYGQGPNSQPIYATPIVRVPSGAYSVNATALNATCAILQLSRFAKVDPCELIDHFKVIQWPSSDITAKTEYYSLYDDFQRGIVSCNLTSETDYTFAVFARNSAGETPSSSINQVRTKRPAPLEAPNCCKVSSADEIGFVVVSWSMSERALQEDAIQGYQVILQSRIGQMAKTRKFDLSLSDGLSSPSRMRLGPVNESVSYTVSVKAYNAGGFGPSSDTALLLPPVMHWNSSGIGLRNSLLLFCASIITLVGQNF